MGQVVHECPRLIERPFPVVISGASGTGKTSVVEKLLSSDGRMVRAITATTRPIRRGEEDGIDYHFMTEAQFAKKIAAGYFAESATVHGQSYGVPKVSISEGLNKGKWVVMNVDVQGGLSIKEAFPSAILIFILPPSMEALTERLTGRGTDSEDEIVKRLKNAENEMLVAPKYDYVVVNDEVKDCTKRLLSIILAETSRTTRGLTMPKE